MAQLHTVTAQAEVVLSLGAIHTPKVLMQSGIGDEAELRRVGVAVRQHLPGVGRNFQDHFGFDCVWQFPETVAGSTQVGSTLFWDSGAAGVEGPDLFACLGPFPEVNSGKYRQIRSTRKQLVPFRLAYPPEQPWPVAVIGPGSVGPHSDRSQRAIAPR